MQNVRAVLAFSWKYIRRYWGRLTLGILCGLIFALGNASFIWAAKTLTERLEAAPSFLAEKRRPITTNESPAEKSFFSKAQERTSSWLEKTNRSVQETI